MDYQLEIKQIVEFPRCRIYRDFVRSLVANKSIRTNGSSFLFYYIVLCSYSNYRSSYRRMEHITYMVGPGEWVCTITELQSWFRCRFQHQALSIMNLLEKQNYITYSTLANRKIIKYKITDWPKDNTVLEYNYPCKKDDGFFFFPIAKVHEHGRHFGSMDTYCLQRSFCSRFRQRSSGLLWFLLGESTAA